MFLTLFQCLTLVGTHVMGHRCECYTCYSVGGSVFKAHHQSVQRDEANR